MSDPLRRILAALDAIPVPVHAFVRDDDMGWDDERLFRLLDIIESAGMPIDLAAIPATVGDALAAAVSERMAASGRRIGVHQHGWRHLNHETQGRKCEFGPARTPAQQRSDLARGRAHLWHLFGPQLDPFFTPPWNRCAPYTPALLAQMGYAVLSRDRGAPAQSRLPECPVDLDWSRLVRDGGVDAVATAFVAAVQQRHADGAPLGLMLHHAAMSDEEFETLHGWLRALAEHPRLHWLPMRELLPRAGAGRVAATATATAAR